MKLTTNKKAYLSSVETNKMILIYE